MRYVLRAVWSLFFGMGWIILPPPAQSMTITLGVNESPPYWSAHLPKDGMCGEIVHAITEEVGLQSVIEYKPLIRLIKDDANNDVGNPVFYLAHQDYAAIIPLVFYQAAFYYYQPNHPSEITVQQLAELKNYTIGTLKGTLVDRAAFARAGILFEESTSQESLLKKLKLARIDLYLEIDLVGRQVVEKLFPREVNNFGSIKIAGSSAPIAIMIAEEQDNAKEIADKYRSGLTRIIENGIYQKILEKYYGKTNVPPNWLKELRRFQRLFDGERGK